MFRNLRSPLILVLAIAFAGPVLAQSDPTLHQIYEAASTGHLDQAQQMMNQVLRDHPQSAKAHYVAAELYAREGNFPSARSELSRAQTLEPGLPFAKPEAVQRLTRELQGNAAGSRFTPAPRDSQVHSAMPWGLILIVVGVIAVFWAMMRRRAAAMYRQYPGGAVAPAAGGPGFGPGPGYGPGYGGPGVGSGIAGGLASGLAVGAGVVAGEELAHRFLDGRAEGVPVDPSQYPQNPNPDMGGSDFGVADGGSWDDGSVGGDVSGGGGDDWT
jgi:uncharacterized protein